jgi:hypothetical protein
MSQQRTAVPHLGSTPVHTGVRPRTHKSPLTKRTALFLPGDMTLAEWKRVGEHIVVLADSSTWWLGDWLVYGQRRHPDRYRRAISETSLDYQTLRNYAWVAAAFPPPRRRAALSFQHDAEVAALSENEQDAWLDRAVELRWSRNTLRREPRAARSRLAPEPAESVRLLVRIDSEQLGRWKRAAGRAQRDLMDWMTGIPPLPRPMLAQNAPFTPLRDAWRGRAGRSRAARPRRTAATWPGSAPASCPSGFPVRGGPRGTRCAAGKRR